MNAKYAKSRKTLNAHHIEDYLNNEKLRYDISNGITLCKKCHIEFHKAFGYGNNTSTQFKQWLFGKLIDYGYYPSTVEDELLLEAHNIYKDFVDEDIVRAYRNI